jgi:type IV secretory pathway protease TraF
MTVAAIGTTMDAGMTPRFVWNASASVPIGLYKVHPAHHLTVTALAVAYPPEPLARWLAQRRYLLRGVPLLKPILALDGQTVCRVGPLITVDGRKNRRCARKGPQRTPASVLAGLSCNRSQRDFSDESARASVA